MSRQGNPVLLVSRFSLLPLVVKFLTKKKRRGGVSFSLRKQPQKRGNDVGPVLALLLVSAVPMPAKTVDSFSLVEVNHLYDTRGRLIFDQVVYYHWSQADQRFQVGAWRIVKSQWHLPRKRTSDGRYIATWIDNGVLRRVVADNMRETWTKDDPEVVEREFLSPEFRRGLTDAAPLKVR